MAQVHYVIMADYDEEVVYAYLSANKGKINKLAKDFEPTEDEDGETRNYIMEQGSTSYKDGFYLEFSNGEFGFVAANEEEFRNKASNFEYGAFWSKIKDVEINFAIEDAGYDESLEFDDADYSGDEPELAWAGYEYIIGESINKQTTMKYVPTFESFTAPQEVSKTNEGFADLADYERKGRLDDMQNWVKRQAADLVRRVKTGIEIDASGDPDYGWEKIALGIIKDAFKKEKIKLK
mgnify:CR=1 FL=1